MDMNISTLLSTNVLFYLLHTITCQGQGQCGLEKIALQEVQMCTNSTSIGQSVLIVDDDIPVDAALSCKCEVWTEENIQVEMLYKGPISTNCGMQVRILDYQFGCPDGFVKPNISGQARMTYTKTTDSSNPGWCLKLSTGSVSNIEVRCYHHGLNISEITTTSTRTMMSQTQESTTHFSHTVFPFTNLTTSQSTYSSRLAVTNSTTPASTGASTTSPVTIVSPSSSPESTKSATTNKTVSTMLATNSETKPSTTVSQLYEMNSTHSFESTSAKVVTTTTVSSSADVPIILVILVPVGCSLILILATATVLIVCQSRRKRNKRSASMALAEFREPNRTSYIEAFVDSREGHTSSILGDSDMNNIAPFTFKNECCVDETQTRVNMNTSKHVPMFGHDLKDSIHPKNSPHQLHHRVSNMCGEQEQGVLGNINEHEHNPAYATIKKCHESMNIPEEDSDIAFGQTSKGHADPEQIVTKVSPQGIGSIQHDYMNITYGKSSKSRPRLSSRTMDNLVPRFQLENGVEYATVIKTPFVKTAQQQTVKFQTDVKVSKTGIEVTPLKGILKNRQVYSAYPEPGYAGIRKHYSDNRENYHGKLRRSCDEHDDDLPEEGITTTVIQ